MLFNGALFYTFEIDNVWMMLWLMSGLLHDWSKQKTAKTNGRLVNSCSNA